MLPSGTKIIVPSFRKHTKDDSWKGSTIKNVRHIEFPPKMGSGRSAILYHKFYTMSMNMKNKVIIFCVRYPVWWQCLARHIVGVCQGIQYKNKGRVQKSKNLS